MAKPTAAQQNDPRRESRRGTGGAKRRVAWVGRSLSSLLMRAGAVAGAIGAVLALVFVLVPSLQPKSSEPPAEKRGDIGVLKVERPVTYQQYLQRTGLPGGDYGRSYLRREGVLVDFDVSITGYNGKDLPLRWSLYDARSGAQISEAKGTTLRAQADTDRATWHVWAPLPHREGRFYLLIQLFDPEGVVPLDQAQTEPFAGRAAGGST